MHNNGVLAKARESKTMSGCIYTTRRTRPHRKFSDTPSVLIMLHALPFLERMQPIRGMRLDCSRHIQRQLTRQSLQMQMKNEAASSTCKKSAQERVVGV